MRFEQRQWARSKGRGTMRAADRLFSKREHALGALPGKNSRLEEACGMTMASPPPKIGRWPRTGWTNRQPKAREPGRWDGRWRPGRWSSDSSLSPGNRDEALVLRRLASGGRLWRGRTAQRRCHAKPVGGKRVCTRNMAGPSALAVPFHRNACWLLAAGCWLLAGTVGTGTTAAIYEAQNPPRKDAVPLLGFC